MMQFLIKKGIHGPVAMYFRNDYMQKYMRSVQIMFLIFIIGETAMKGSIAI
jgi:hypothetical protein